MSGKRVQWEKEYFLTNDLKSVILNFILKKDMPSIKVHTFF